MRIHHTNNIKSINSNQIQLFKSIQNNIFIHVGRFGIIIKPCGTLLKKMPPLGRRELGRIFTPPFVGGLISIFYGLFSQTVKCSILRASLHLALFCASLIQRLPIYLSYFDLPPFILPASVSILEVLLLHLFSALLITYFNTFIVVKFYMLERKETQSCSSKNCSNLVGN